jgi:hypothetical protein
MASTETFDYTVVLIFPGFGAEKEHAEAVIEGALEWLNTNKDEPGFRFAPPVSAHLQIVQDADEARALIATDDSVAMLFLHDLDEDERDALMRECESREVPTCYTVDTPRRPGPRKEPFRVVIRKKSAEDRPGHRVAAGTLTDPVDDEEDTAGRVGELIAVLALGVMEHHWRKHPPRIPRPEGL